MTATLRDRALACALTNSGCIYKPSIQTRRTTTVVRHDTWCPMANTGREYFIVVNTKENPCPT